MPKEVVLHQFNEAEAEDTDGIGPSSKAITHDVKDITVEIPEQKPKDEAGHRLQKPMSGSSRIEKMEQLAVDHEIVRGIPLRESLKNFGRLWRWSPLDLVEEDRKKLWNRSKKVTGFDVFLSHTWLTKGRWKVLTLLLRSGWHIMLLGWLVATILAILLCLNGVLPMAAVWHVSLDDWNGDWNGLLDLDRGHEWRISGTFSLSLYPWQYQQVRGLLSRCGSVMLRQIITVMFRFVIV